MNLNKKKALAAKVLRVGKGRIIFKNENLKEIKEAITRQDIKQLYSEGIIKIKDIKGRRKIVKRKYRRGPGKIKMKINRRKQNYVKITRKLRGYLMSLKNMSLIERELYKKLRNKIRMREFKSKSNMKEYLKSLGIKLETNKKGIKENTKIKI
ncbi:MAG: 50S ribosomal protein L19e [Nanoarchaeota archaeon]